MEDFNLYNTTIIYHIWDKDDEYDVSKIGNEGNTEWKWEVESLTYGPISKRTNLYKNLIQYCSEL
jgi:hypothetical protein